MSRAARWVRVRASIHQNSPAGHGAGASRSGLHVSGLLLWSNLHVHYLTTPHAPLGHTDNWTVQARSSLYHEGNREVTTLSLGAQRSRAGPLLTRAHTQGPGVGTLSQPRPEDSGLSDRGEWGPRLGRRHRDNYRHQVFHLCPRFTAVRPLKGQSPGTFTTGAGSRVTRS